MKTTTVDDQHLQPEKRTRMSGEERRACEEGYLSATVNSDAATWGYMSMILALQYGSMLNLAEPIARVQEETCRIWLRGLLSHEGQ